jgi:hypothetical protein
LAPFPPVAEGCQSFTEPNLSTLLYKSKASPNRRDLKYAAKIHFFLFELFVFRRTNGRSGIKLFGVTPFFNEIAIFVPESKQVLWILKCILNRWRNR